MILQVAFFSTSQLQQEFPYDLTSPQPENNIRKENSVRSLQKKKDENVQYSENFWKHVDFLLNCEQGAGASLQPPDMARQRGHF